MNVQERKVSFAALDLPDKRAVEFGIESKLFLGNAFLLSQPPHIFTKLLQTFFVGLHLWRVAGLRSINPRSLSSIPLDVRFAAAYGAALQMQRIFHVQDC